jgi:hypothetical protein
VTRITPVLATSSLSGRQILRALLRKGAGALVKKPVIWYLPSSPRMGSDGRPCSFVPRKAVFDRRSNTAVSCSVRYRFLSYRI